MNAKVLGLLLLACVASAMQCPAGIYKHCESCDNVGNCEVCSRGYHKDGEGLCVSDHLVTYADSGSEEPIKHCLDENRGDNTCNVCDTDYCYAKDACWPKNDWHFKFDCVQRADQIRDQFEFAQCKKGYSGKYCDHKDEGKSDGLSTGAVVGIVIAAIIFVIILVILIVAVVRHQKAKKAYHGDATLFEDDIEFDSFSVL